MKNCVQIFIALIVMAILAGSAFAGIRRNKHKTMMPNSQLTEVRILSYGMIAQPLYSYRVKSEKDGTVTCAYFDQSRNCYVRCRVKAELLDEMRAVIESHKMHRYKRLYTNPDVLDGISWKFEVIFADGQSLYSSGSNAWPRDNGCEILRDMCAEAVASGVYLSLANEQGEAIPEPADGE